MSVLTSRQEQIKERLDVGMSAQQIGDELGISRNAVYQVISRLKRLGIVSTRYTPSGAPPRSPEFTESVSPIVTGVTVTPVTTQLLNELLTIREDLAAVVTRIDTYIGVDDAG